MKYAYGDIVAAAGGTYVSKPRPVLVFQDPSSATGESVIVIPFTSVANTKIQMRVAVSPTAGNGLDRDCYLEVDKLSAIQVASIGKKIGALEVALLVRAQALTRELLMLDSS